MPIMPALEGGQPAVQGHPQVHNELVSLTLKDPVLVKKKKVDCCDSSTIYYLEFKGSLGFSVNTKSSLYYRM